MGKKIMGYLEKYTIWLEIAITILIAVGITIGLLDIGTYLIEIFHARLNVSYEVFQQFLAHSLLLIVGVELMLMIINHSTKAILELILFVIARKMLIYASTMQELVWGTVAIAVVYIIMKYLMTPTDLLGRDNRVHSASRRVQDLYASGIVLPLDKGDTLGGLVFRLAQEQNKPIKEGQEFDLGAVIVRIVKATAGVIEQVMVLDKDENGNAKQ